MRNSLLKYILLAALWLGISVVLTCCRDDRQDNGWRNQDFSMDETLAATSKDSVDFILKKAMLNNTRFSTFSTNLNIKINLDGFSMGFNGQLRVKNNQILWFACQKFMFELVRIKMTPDSLAFYSKLGNVAGLYSGDSARVMIENSFTLLQCLFMRNIDSVMLRGDRKLSSSPQSWIIDGLAEDSVAWQVSIDREDFRIENILIHVAENRSVLQIAVNYLNENDFNISISENQKLLIRAGISYSKMRWNETTGFPFVFPSNIEVSRNQGLLRTIEQGRKQMLGSE